MQGQAQPSQGTELRHMLDLCLYFIPAHRLKVRALLFCNGTLGTSTPR